MAEAVMDVMVEVFTLPPMQRQPKNFQHPNANQPRQKVAPAYRQAPGDSSHSASEMHKKKQRTVRVHKSQVSGVPTRWGRIEIPPVEERVYQEHVTTAVWSELEVNAYRLTNEIIVSGRDVPKPMLILEEASLPRCLRDWLETKNCHNVTSIQDQCWSVVFNGRDDLVVGQSGSEAKAVAYLVPAVVHVVSQPPSKYGDAPVALFVIANREMAREVHRLSCEIEEYTKVGAACSSNGDSKQPLLEELEKDPPICIATLSRLVTRLAEGSLDLLRCTYVVFDGVDRVVVTGMEDHVLAIEQWLRPDRQTQIWLSSRTQDVHPLCEDLLEDYVLVSIGVKTTPSDQSIEQIAIVCEEAEKNDRLVTVLEDILKEERHKVIIFVETKQTVDDIATLLLLREWPVVGVHGKKRDDELDGALAAFRGDGARVLVSTDMCERKLDGAGNVRYVINYDYPRSTEVYKRRLRYASGSDGVAVAYTFFTSQDKRHACKFVSILRDAKQVVPRELREMAKGTARNRRAGVGCTGKLGVV
ncbi:probable ATP-dependent RNA helicase DDX5 [Rhipicephalus sanguineus]|uniref:probable ATP-dependent RNA helicase DDX5 n=1 Tax=Rhipicephalus sanguineus TaxID=34632 RepID=UPI0018959B71|nr:probable ATP-dependent RNA helicase DDX5 [Rhipicephalus sanguineus]